MGLKRSFITDLKLRGVWQSYSMKDSDFTVDFTPPVLYDLYQQQKMLAAKMDTYKVVVDNEEFSKTVAMRKILKMTDDEIDENFRALIKEKQMVALADYFADKISDENKPLDYKSPLRLSGEEGGVDGENSADGGTGGGSSGVSASDEDVQEEESGDEGGGEAPSFGLG